MSETKDPLAAMIFNEIFMADQLARAHLARVLPRGMELSHLMVLNALATTSGPLTPAQLARSFNLTRGAMTNTLRKLEWAGHIHISPDWEDARRKQIVISPAGGAARKAALEQIEPILSEFVDTVGYDKIRDALPVIRALRMKLERSK